MGVKFLSKSGGHCQIMGHMMVQEQNEWLKSISRVRKHRIRTPKCITFNQFGKIQFFDLKISWAWPDYGSRDGSRAKLMA